MMSKRWIAFSRDDRERTSPLTLDLGVACACLESEHYMLWP